MLLSLYVENIALIKKLNIDISEGFTVLTGETGGGKSIIIDSLSLLCGARGDKSLIRTGEDSATVEGLFSADVSKLGDDAEYADNDGNVTVYRRITADGRSVCRLGGRNVPVSKLKSFMDTMLNIHGQQDTQSLSDVTTHIGLLDSYAGNGKLLEEYEKKYGIYRDLVSETERLEKIGEDKLLRLDVLDFQINELENAAIRPGEETELENEKNVLANYEKIMTAVRSAVESLDGRESALSKIRKANDAISRIDTYLADAADYVKRLESCTYEISDIVSCLKDSVDTEYDSPDRRIDEIEDRLVLISRLKRKYRLDEEGLVKRLGELKTEKEELDLNDELLGEKKKELKNAESGLEKAAEELSASRKEAAKRLESEIEKNLASLDMPSVTFVTEFSRIPFAENGYDSAEFLISANKGEEPRPIARIASGGELSRIMLSVKSAFAEIDGVKTVVFDEIDTGISGKTSEKLGLSLKELNKKGIQVLCVTHSSQIACLADTHLRVSKAVDGDRTYTSVKKLDFEERVEEISRIIGGITVTDSVRQAARESLLQKNVKKCSD